jgi:hypothetical protein
MTRNATGFWRSASTRTLIAGAAAALLAGCASAGGEQAINWTAPPGNGLTRVSADKLDPASDPIPPILIQARKSPYALTNTGSCERIGQEMALLNAVLGEDYDTATARERPDGNAGETLASLIPFRGVFREVSGASRKEWEFRESISAGLMRRAYLKGRGEQMGCAYPSRPFPVGPVTDPTNFDDLSDQPQPQQPAADPRRMASARG